MYNIGTMKKPTKHFDVVVVGGGPSGMMAAGRAAERGFSVAILEKNKDVGDKLKITGGRRCNITNAEYDNHKFLQNFGDAGKFLFSPFSQHSVSDTFRFFEKKGLPLVIEGRKRTFPRTQRAYDVYAVMKQYMKDNKVSIITNSAVLKIVSENDNIVNVQTLDCVYSADSFVFATGGTAAPETGSTGDGFKWLEKIGHTVKQSSPNVVPLRVNEKWVHELSGTSLSFMKITFFLNGVKSFSKKGKVLFTHFGLSGPLILNSSYEVQQLLKAGEVVANIDMFPDTDLGLMEKKMLKIFDANKNKLLKNVLDLITPEGMSSALESHLTTEELETKVHSVTVEQRKYIIAFLKSMPINIAGTMGFDRAVISDGGIILEEVDMKHMKSRLYKNLFVTGDLLNINRPSGGFSLQLCWTTGWVAGSSVGKTQE